MQIKAPQTPILVRFARHLLIYVLGFLMGFGPTLHAASEPDRSIYPPRITDDHSTPQSIKELTRARQSAFEHPLFQAIKEAKDLPPINMEFASSDPLLDEDPYFLRSQLWSDLPPEAPTDSSNVFVREETHQVEISLAHLGIEKTWTLQKPFHPILFNEDYVIFWANDLEFFKGKAGDDQHQFGLFIAQVPQLQEAAKTERSVPLYYFPLPQANWTVGLNAVDAKNLESILLMDPSGEFLPIFYEHIEKVLLVGHMAYLFATINSMSSTHLNQSALRSKFDDFFNTLKEGGDREEVNQASSNLMRLFNLQPAPYSTVGFGLAAIPSKKKASSLINKDSETKNDLLKKIGSGIGFLLGIESVHAQTQSTPTYSEPSPTFVDRLEEMAFGSKDGLSPEQLQRVEAANEELYERIEWVCLVLGTIFIASIVLRYTVLNKKFKHLRALDKREQRLKGNTDYKPGVFTHIREWFDVNAHTLLTTAQSARVTVSNVIENTFDRHAPWLGSSQNSMVRKLLDRTVLFSRETAKGLPVNWDTWKKGSIMHGGMDTLFVFVQLYQVTPWMSYRLMEMVPWLESRVEEAFKPGDPLIQNLNRNEVIRNLFSYLSTGAVTFSLQLKEQILIIVGAEVDRELRSEGYNPGDPQTKAEREKRIEEKFRAYARRFGLPNKERFIFDWFSIYQTWYWFKGNQLNAPWQTGDQLEMEAYDHGPLTAEARPGLVPSALKRAVRHLKKEVRKNSEDAEAQEALKILQQTKSDYSYLTNLTKTIVTKPHRLTEGYHAVRRVRKNLVRLSWLGEPTIKASQLPSDWFEQFDEKGALKAAQTFRAAMFGIVEGRSIQNIIETGTDHHESETFEPDADSWYSEYQKEKILDRADQSFEKKYAKPFDPVTASEEERIAWREGYVRAWMNTVGLFPDYKGDPELEKKVKSEAKITADQAIKHEAFQDFARELHPKVRAVYEAQEYAKMEVAAYTKNTLRDETYDPLSPAQPGVFQRLRQTSFLRKETFFRRQVVTRALRAYEALQGDSAYGLGFGAKIFRNIPMVSDWFNPFKAIIMRAPMALTASFAFNDLFWGADISWKMWAYFFLAMNVTIAGPHYTTYRFFAFQGWKPMGVGWRADVLMLVFSTIITWTTFWGVIPGYIFARDAQTYFWPLLISLGIGVASWNVVNDLHRRFAEWRAKRRLKKQNAGIKTRGPLSRALSPVEKATGACTNAVSRLFKAGSAVLSFKSK